MPEAVPALSQRATRWAMSLTLLAGDVLGGLVTGGVLWAVLPAGLLPGFDPALMAGGAGAVLATYAITGLYHHPLVHPAEEMQRLGTVTAGLGCALAVALALVHPSAAPALLALGGGLLGACLIPATRGLCRILGAQSAWWGLPTVVLGTDRLGASVVDTLRRWPEIGLRPVARLTDAPRPSTDAADGLPIVGSVSEAPMLAQQHDIPHAIVALPNLSHAERAKRVATYSKFFDHVFVVADADDGPALWTTGTSGRSLMGYDVRHYDMRPLARWMKRGIDLIGALAALILLAPLFGILAVLIKIDDPGPVLFRQHRMGRQGRVFTVFKFRTMYTDADQKLRDILESDPARRREYERFHKLQDDPRVTSIGRLLRASSLDELPQLLNVLRGEMSLVGPRAYMPGELPKMNGLSRAILQTPPGITGLWQVSGRNHLSFDARVNLDVHYIQHWSPWLDLYLLVRTLPVVFTGDGAC